MIFLAEFDLRGSYLPTLTEHIPTLSMDSATAATVVQIQLADISDFFQHNAGDGKVQALSDIQFAFKLYQDDLKQRNDSLQDRCMASSIAEAVRTDEHAIATACRDAQFPPQDSQAVCEAHVALNHSHLIPPESVFPVIYGIEGSNNSMPHQSLPRELQNSPSNNGKEDTPLDIQQEQFHQNDALAQGKKESDQGKLKLTISIREESPSLNEEIRQFVEQEYEEVFQCKVPGCTKRFKSDAFWRKHLKNRHPACCTGFKDNVSRRTPADSHAKHLSDTSLQPLQKAVEQ